MIDIKEIKIATSLEGCDPSITVEDVVQALEDELKRIGVSYHINVHLNVDATDIHF